SLDETRSQVRSTLRPEDGLVTSLGHRHEGAVGEESCRLAHLGGWDAVVEIAGQGQRGCKRVDGRRRSHRGGSGGFLPIQAVPAKEAEYAVSRGLPAKRPEVPEGQGRNCGV